MLGHTQCGVHADENAAIATLQCLASAQRQCRETACIDADGDGRGEFGGFAALAGSVPQSTGQGLRRIEPPLISPTFASPTDDVVVRSGYCFRIFLPEPGRSTDAAELRWHAFAWPVELTDARRRAFFVSEEGDVLGCRNTRGWAGTQAGPTADTPRPRAHRSLKPPPPDDVWVIVQ